MFPHGRNREIPRWRDVARRSRLEGRISAGVGSGSDVGGGASIMGTLSGGGKERITVGERCLIGANAGIGISLGDDCIVEAGCYVTQARASFWKMAEY